MSVVKADAHGHGDIEVVDALMKEGCSNWAVSNVEEVCRLRGIGCVGQILILGYTPIGNLKRVQDYEITQALLSEEYARLVYESG